MKFTLAIDLYLEDMRSQGRINSDRTETSYRSRLMAHVGLLRDAPAVGMGWEEAA